MFGVKLTPNIKDVKKFEHNRRIKWKTQGRFEILGKSAAKWYNEWGNLISP